MARQEENEAFQLSSFLYGGNAAYLEDLYARYQERSGLGRCRLARASSPTLKDPKDSAIAEARGPKWRRSDWPIVANGEIVAAFDANWVPVEQQIGEKIKAGAQARGVEVSEQRGLPGDARFRPRPDDDPRLPDARPSARQPRSARA